MRPSPLCVVCDADVCARARWSLLDFAAACLDGGARFLQIRAKRASGRLLLELAGAVVELASARGALVLVNDRADVARMAGAGGVHVGQDDLTPTGVRGVLGPSALIGLSTHTPAQVERGCREPVDYLAVGPVFGTDTKETGYQPLGLRGVGEAARLAANSDLPIVAIGGITLDRARGVIQAGAQSVAVISDLLSTGDPAARVAAYLDALAAGKT